MLLNNALIFQRTENVDNKNLNKKVVKKAARRSRNKKCFWEVQAQSLKANQVEISGVRSSSFIIEFKDELLNLENACPAVSVHYF